MGKHNRDREYGNVVCTFTPPGPRIYQVERALRNYREVLTGLGLDPNEYARTARLTISPPLNHWTQFQTMGWHLDLDEYDKETPF